jgi:hypothetical protein
MLTQTYYRSRAPRIHKPNHGKRKARHWAICLQYDAERHVLSLGTQDQEEATANAEEMHRYLVANGWQVFWQKYRPKEKRLSNEGYESRCGIIAPFSIPIGRVEDPSVVADAQRAVRKAIASRQLSSKPCAVCGEREAHAHHPDYSQPLRVIFLCPIHHGKLHGLLRRRFFDSSD